MNNGSPWTLEHAHDLSTIAYEVASASKKESLISLHRQLAPVSLVVCNTKKQLIFGHEWVRELLAQEGQDAVCAVQVVDVFGLQAWLLSHRILASYHLISLYEHLNLWLNIAGKMPPEELQRLVAFPFTLPADLQMRLSDAFFGPLRILLEKDLVVWQVMFRLLRRDPGEWPAWAELLSLAHFSRSRQIALLDVLEEIIFRDKTSLAEILAVIPKEFSPSVDVGVQIWDLLFKIRYPHTTNLEKDWQTKLAGLRLPREFSLSHMPFFESEKVDLTATFPTYDHFLSYWQRSE